MSQRHWKPGKVGPNYRERHLKRHGAGVVEAVAPTPGPPGPSRRHNIRDARKRRQARRARRGW